MKVAVGLVVLSFFPPSLVPVASGWSLSGLFRSHRRQHQRVIVEFSQANDAHAFFMERALNEAKRARKAGEVPIGALIVRNLTAAELSLAKWNEIENKVSTKPSKIHLARPPLADVSPTWTMEIVSTGFNIVERNVDASAHAELVAMRRAAVCLDNWRLRHCTLYTTLEPCPMCLSAALGFRIESIVYGAPDLRLGAIESYQQMLQLPHPFHTISTVESGVCQEESARLLRDFFRERRQRGQKALVSSASSHRFFFQRRSRNEAP
jgi:tRNA(adenine34) deaminase